MSGTDVWSYRAERPEELAIFDGAVTSSTGLVESAVIDVYDFARFREVVDLAGSHGVLLAATLARHSGVDGVLWRWALPRMRAARLRVGLDDVTVDVPVPVADADGART